MIKIKKYDTEIDNFYMFVSHNKDGSPNVTYGLVKDNGKTMHEIIPKFGPITVLNSDSDVIDDYINGKCCRGNWWQQLYDDECINDLLSNGQFDIIANFLEKDF